MCTGLLKCIRTQYVHITSLYLKFSPQNTFLIFFSVFINSQIKNFRKSANCLSKYWVLQNGDTIIHLLNNINNKACRIYCNIWLSKIMHKLPYDKLKSKLSSIVDFAFKRGDKAFIRLSNNGMALEKWNERGTRLWQNMT